MSQKKSLRNCGQDRPVLGWKLLTAAAAVAVAGLPIAAPIGVSGASVAYARTAESALVVESIGTQTHRFFRDAAARDAALPSYALEKPIAGQPAGIVPGVAPEFSTIDGKQAATITLPAGTSMYGTGEVAGPLLRNGRTTVCWNTDAYGYGDEAISLYQSHPWVLAVRPDGTSVGILADTTWRCEVDTGARDPNQVVFIADGPAFPVIVIERATPQDVLKELARLTGTMPLPPKWAVGYHQCRYSYYPEARVREIAREFRERDIPCDVIWFDIDYYDSFRVFTFNKEYFPDPAKLNADLLREGFHNVWMINPGIKREDGAGVTQIFDSGNAEDVWVKTANGATYSGEVWPGWCVFPDYTQPRVRDWWADFYAPFIAQGITGVWNDMNEPAIFNVPSKTMPEDNVHRGDPTMVKPNGQPQGDQAVGPHARYHNVYGMMMVKGTREGIEAAMPDKRPFILSRANYIGGHRYAATWTGDNSANWYHLEASIPMTLNVGLSGQPFIGPDIGGFAGDGDAKLFSRWMGFGALLPFSRGHTGKGNIDKEPWAFGPEIEATSREALKRRYRLLPYFYTLFREASVNGMPVARPTFFADITDPALRSEDDSFLLGSDVLVVGSMIPDGSRVAVMPKGVWREIERSDDPDLPDMFIRGGAIVPTGPDIAFANEKPLDPLTLLVAPDANGNATGQLYEDAGDGYGYRNGEYLLSEYTAARNGGAIEVRVRTVEGSMARPDRNVVVKILGEKGVLAQGGGKDGGVIRIEMQQ